MQQIRFSIKRSLELELEWLGSDLFEDAIKVEIRITKEEIMTIKLEKGEILRKRDLFAHIVKL